MYASPQKLARPLRLSCHFPSLKQICPRPSQLDRRWQRWSERSWNDCECKWSTMPFKGLTCTSIMRNRYCNACRNESAKLNKAQQGGDGPWNDDARWPSEFGRPPPLNIESGAGVGGGKISTRLILSECMTIRKTRAWRLPCMSHMSRTVSLRDEDFRVWRSPGTREANAPEVPFCFLAPERNPGTSCNPVEKWRSPVRRTRAAFSRKESFSKSLH